MDDVLRDLRERRASAVLVSVARCDARDAARVAMVVREFPRVPAVALLSQLEERTAKAVLSLGRSGVRTLVDVRQPDGWRELRQILLADQAGRIEQLAVRHLTADLLGAPEDCLQFFEALFHCSPQINTVRELSRILVVVPSTLMSRFYRERLPSPKRYLAMARLTRAAQLFENGGLSIANIADRLDYSSPQSFGRHIRGLVGLTANEFRDRFDGEGMLQRFREELVTPYLSTLSSFHPLTTPAPEREQSARSVVHARDDL
jgi:AraC-like DNA-binding protein